MPSPIVAAKTIRQYNISFVEEHASPERPRSIDRCIEQNDETILRLKAKASADPSPNALVVMDFNLALQSVRESSALLEEAAKADALGQRWKAAKLLVSALECSDRARRLADLVNSEDSVYYQNKKVQR